MRERAAAAAVSLVLATCLLGLVAESSGRRVVVERVIDGDTVDVRDGDRVVRVRLIGVDTPELHSSAKLDAQVRRGWDRAVITRLGRRAADATRRLLDVGRPVRLELDVETHDRYGRLLAYVWRDDLLVNAELLRQGYARRLTIPPNVRYVEWFARLEAAARAAHRGLWASWPPVRRPADPRPGTHAAPPASGAQVVPDRGGPRSRAARRSTRASDGARTGRGTGPACVRRA